MRRSPPRFDSSARAALLSCVADGLRGDRGPLSVLATTFTKAAGLGRQSWGLVLWSSARVSVGILPIGLLFFAVKRESFSCVHVRKPTLVWATITV